MDKLNEYIEIINSLLFPYAILSLYKKLENNYVFKIDYSSNDYVEVKQLDLKDSLIMKIQDLSFIYFGNEEVNFNKAKTIFVIQRRGK